VRAVLVRRRSASGNGAAVLYIHGYVDYFFQRHLAEFFNDRGVHFYALDLRRHGRALMPHQQPNVVHDMDELLVDVAAAIDVLAEHEGVEWLLANGHSTGGLVAALFAARGQGRERVDALILNSPFLDMNLPAWQAKLLEPVLAGLGAVFPNLRLPGLSPLYGESLHVGQRGAWQYDTAWKPIAGFPTRAGWFRAVHRAQAEVAAGLDIACPVLVLHAERSKRPQVWHEDIRGADIVLDIEDMKRLARRLGPAVEVQGVPGGIHDLVLSEPAARGDTFARKGAWLDRERAASRTSFQ
jgi:alpha-beta hydrolase superfamily lysophospholipase